MTKILLLLVAIAFTSVAAHAQSNPSPNYCSYAETGNPDCLQTAPNVAKDIGQRVFQKNGYSTGQTLDSAIIGALQVNLVGGTPVVSCPVGSCPPASSAQLTHAGFQQYAVSNLDKNWEIGGVFGILDTTGGGTGGANDHTDGAKMALYAGIMQTLTGGPAWALNTNVVRCATPGSDNSLPGFAGAGNACTTAQRGTMDVYSSTIGYELDLSNFDRDANGLPPQYPFVVGEYVTTSSFYPGWAAIFYGIGQGQTSDAWHNGILFSSPNSGGGRTIADNTFLDLSNSDVGYHAQGTHKKTGWYDESTGQFGVWIVGTKSVEDIDLSTGTPVGIGINGTRSYEAIHLNVTAPNGIVDTGTHVGGSSYADNSSGDSALQLNGAYARAAVDTENATTTNAVVAKQGQNVCWKGLNACVQYDGSKLVYSKDAIRLFAIDDSGNMTLKGTLTSNGSP